MPCDSTQTHERLDICGGSAGTVMWSGSESPLIVVHLELTAVAMSRVRRDGCSAPLRRAAWTSTRYGRRESRVAAFMVVGGVWLYGYG